MTTEAPCFEHSSATARPTPLAPPEITTTLFFKILFKVKSSLEIYTSGSQASWLNGYGCVDIEALQQHVQPVSVRHRDGSHDLFERH